MLTFRAASTALGFVLLCALWLQFGALFGIGLALVFVLAGSALLLLLAMGVDGARYTLIGTLERLGEGLRDPRDTLTHILMLTEHSRRNGLVGLGDVETNWSPLQRVCALVASAADEQRIRIESAATVDAARQTSNSLITPWVGLALLLPGVGVFGSVLSIFDHQLGGGATVPAHALAPLVIGIAALLLGALPVLLRLMVGRERELACVQLAFEGALRMLQNNNVDSVFHELASLVPGARSAVKLSEIGELDTGSGPWL